MLTKDELRSKYISERRSRYLLDINSHELASAAIVEHASELIRRSAAKNVMLYLPINGEADVTGLNALPVSLYVPVTHGVVITPAFYTSDTELIKGSFGVPAPARPEYVDKKVIDLALIPAVAVDRHKNRLGYGKGCYDRFLADMDCVKAAVVFDFQLADELEVHPYDIKMDYIITESGYF